MYCSPGEEDWGLGVVVAAIYMYKNKEVHFIVKYFCPVGGGGSVNTSH